MKLNIWYILAALVVIGFTGAKCMAQTLPGSEGRAAFIGGSYTSDNVLSINIGGAKQLTGHFYGATGLTFGTFKGAPVSGIVKGVYFLNATDFFAFGPIVGAGFSISDNDPDPITSLVNAAGFLGVFRLWDKTGLYAGGEYLAAFDGEAQYIDGWKGYAGLAMSF